jgi:hypothetical protein
MAIEKESTGVPEVDFSRRTTKVNLGIIVAAAVFFVITITIVFYYVRRSDAETNTPSPPLQSAPAADKAGGAPAAPAGR